MFVVESETAGPLLFSLDNTVKHPSRLSPDVRLLQAYDEAKSAIDSSSPRNQLKADSESVRRKLCDSLTSALQMVVSKQLVKSVLGVVKDTESDAEVGNLSRQRQFKPQVRVIVDGEDVSRFCEEEVRNPDKGSQSNKSFSMDMGLKNLLGVMGDLEDEALAALSPANNPGQRESHSEVKELFASKLMSEREKRVPIFEKTKGGLQLMEQAKRVACNVELNLFSVNGSVNKKYKEKARSLLFNLKDKSNPELRARVFDGEITPATLVRMSADQLASKELSQWRTAKAEEFASMVVLTDADLDPRRIVKKTHKGEFQVVTEAIDFSVTAQNGSIRPAISMNVKNDGQGSKGGDPSYGRVVGRGTKSKFLGDGGILLSPCLLEKVENKIFAEERMAKDARKYLSPIDIRDDTVIVNTEGPHNADASVEEGTLDAFDSMPTSQSCRDKILTVSLAVRSENYTLNLSKTRNNRNTESGNANVSSLPQRMKRKCCAAVWEGSIQLSATRHAPINGFYKSGEKLELKDWPMSVEVKGRVRVVALDKFLQDLQLSRSRTVTILSICPSDCQGDVKQTNAYLQEMADQYRIGGRAGFVEPRPGFELYLLAPSSPLLEPLSLEDLMSIKETRKKEEEVLIGVVVWRKSQSQGLPSNKGPEAQNVSVKDVAVSNLVFESHTEVGAKPLLYTDTYASEGWLPACQKTASASSFVNVSGNSAVHATEPHCDFSTICNAAIRRDWQLPCPAIDPTLVGPMDKIAENAHSAVPYSLSLLHQSVDLKDIPPGFQPKPLQSFSQVRSAALNGDSGEHARCCQAPATYLSSIPSQVCLVPDGGEEVSKDAPPGFLPELSETAYQGTHTATPEDEDDLPEFNFEVEGLVPQSSSNHLFPASRTQLLVPHIRTVAPQSFARLQLMSSPSSRYQGHHHSVHDPHPPPSEFHPVLDRHIPRSISRCESSFAPGTVSTGLPIKGWVNSRERRVESVPALIHDCPMTMLPMNGTGLRSPQLRALTDTTGEDGCCKSGRDSEMVLGPSVASPSGFLSSGLTFPNRVRESLENHQPRHDLFDWCTPSLLTQAVLPSGPPVLRDHILRSRQQISLLHMVVQHQHAVTKNRAFNWLPRGASLPQQEVQCEYQQDLGTRDPFKWQQSVSGQMHPSSANLYRKPDQQKRCYIDNKGGSGDDMKPMRCTKERTRVRERSQEPSISPSRQRGHKRQGIRSRSPTREKSPTKVGLGNIEPSSGQRVSKLVKRGRERERDQ